MREMEFIGQILSFLQFEILGVKLSVYLLSFLAILGGFLVRFILNLIFRKLERLSRKTKNVFDDIIVSSVSAPVGWFAVIGGVFIAASLFPLPEKPVNIARFVPALFRGMTVVVVVWVLLRMTNGFTSVWIENAKKKQSKLEIQVAPIVSRSLKVFLIAVGVLLFLQNLGYSVGSLLAGLGIGGMAVALASKDTLSNLFGAVVIFIDKPFQVGDWIEVGDVEGTVEEIRLRTTKIRTFANSLVTLPNASLTTTSINNWSRMRKRRIKTTIGITYGTPPEKVREAVEKIRQIIRDEGDIHSDFFLVYFDEFGPSSLNIFIYCFTVTTKWAEYLAVKERFYLKIMEEFEKLGVEFAFPTQTIHIASMPEEARLRR